MFQELTHVLSPIQEEDKVDNHEEALIPIGSEEHGFQQCIEHEVDLCACFYSILHYFENGLIICLQMTSRLIQILTILKNLL
jgi:hypothetical protein